MTPRFADFFRSYYYPRTYLPAVDLSEKALTLHHFNQENKKLAITIQQLISQPEVQRVLSEPFSYDLEEEVPRRNQILQNYHFKLLSQKQNTPYYNVLEHKDIEGWIIKSGAIRVLKDEFVKGCQNDRGEMAFFTEEEGLLRIEMSHRIKKIARQIGIDAIIPEKKLVAYANATLVTDPTRRYCLICKKVDVLSAEETLQKIKAMEARAQREIANKLSMLIQAIGIVDASFQNIRMTIKGELAFIDTEPAGLMVAKKGGLRFKFFSTKGASVEKCARIGLFILKKQVSDDKGDCLPGLEPFYKQIEKDYIGTFSAYSKKKIIFSILSLGLIPLVNLIVALVKTQLARAAFEKLKKINDEYDLAITNYFESKVAGLEGEERDEKMEVAFQELKKEEFFKSIDKELALFSKKYYVVIENVPCKT